MKILVFGMTQQCGGIENFIYNFYDSLSNKMNLDFISTDSHIYYEKKFVENGSYIYYLPNFKKQPISYYKKLKKILLSNKYDAVYINMLSAANILPVLVASKLKIKIICHSHSSDIKGSILKKILHYANRKVLIRKSNVNLACSNEAGKWLFKNAQFEVIYNCIDSSKFYYSQKQRIEIRNKINYDGFIIGHVGRFSKEKNHKFMIKIINKVKEEHIDAKLLLVGDGFLFNHIRKKVNKLQLNDYVIFVGVTSETYKYYSAMDCFILPSYFEGISLVAIEAQYEGLPCIFSTNVSEDTKISKNCYFLDINNKNAESIWMDKIKEIQAEPRNKANVLNKKYNLHENQIKLINIFEKSIEI